jgi:hypothetical protein
MYKVMAFLSKKKELTMTEFMDYYEKHHVPLVLRLAASPQVYKRHYLRRDQELSQSGRVVDFDAVVELVFASAEAFHRDWLQPLVLSEQNGPVIAEDEARFLDRSQTKAYVLVDD